MPQISKFSAYYVEGMSMKPELRNDKDKFFDYLSGGQGEENGVIYVEITNWRSENGWTEISIDLTKRITSIGQYELIFESTHGKPEFRDWEMELYGSTMGNHLEYLGEGKFRITRSQQTLDEFPAIFRVKMRNKKDKASGTVKLRKLEY